MLYSIKYAFYTLIALVAFAGNSVLCRLALGEQTIDATSFTLVRLMSGAISLWLIVFAVKLYSQQNKDKGKLIKSSKAAFNYSKIPNMQQWLSGFMLFAYAAGFSYAYIELDTGVGALVLFGCVQLTMILTSIYMREKLSLMQWIGLFCAFAGLVYLIDSQHNLASASISFTGFALMIIAGVAWGVYTLLGRGSNTPLRDTSRNFLLSIPFAICLLLVFAYIPATLTYKGIVLALASGVITSGLGYAIWYVALVGLSRVQAGVVQLFVPVLAALGGVIWANEGVSTELVVSQVVILGGIALVMFAKK